MSEMTTAVIVFIGTYVWLASEITPRYVVALCGASAFILAHILTLPEALAQVNWQMIALLLGMFTIVAALSESGFFNWLALSVARFLKYSPTKVFLVFPLLAAGLSMFLDNITVMVFLTALTLELCEFIALDPIVLISAEVCAANSGGGSTLIGAPPNLVMGTTLGYSFNNFLVHMAPTAWICTLTLVAIYYLFHRTHLNGIRVHNRSHLDAVNLGEKITDRALMKAGLWTLTAAITLLITHPVLKMHFHIPFSLGLAAMVPALFLIMYEGGHRREVIRRIDFESLIFFAALFVIVGGLNKAGVFHALAGFLFAHIHSPFAIILGFLWFAAIASAFVDNVPMALSMAFFIKELGGIPGAPPERIVAWSSLIGLLLGGNMTPIGASPNVIAYGILEKRRMKVGWKKWARLTIPSTMTALIVGSLLMCFKYSIGWY